MSMKKEKLTRRDFVKISTAVGAGAFTGIQFGSADIKSAYAEKSVKGNMFKSEQIKQMLSGKNVAQEIYSAVKSNNRFSFIESLRFEAVGSYKDSGSQYYDKDFIQLVNAETIMLQRQFESIDNAIYQTLSKEGRTDMYDLHDRDDDPDLPKNPEDLNNPVIAYRYALMRLYRRQFEVTVNAQKDGCWPLIVYDILEPVDGKRILLVSKIKQAVDEHASAEFIRNLSRQNLTDIKNVLISTRADLERLLSENSMRELSQIGISGKAKIVKAIITKVWAWVEKMVVGVEAVEIAKEAAEKAEREAKERHEREAQERYRRELGIGEFREIKGSSDYVDRFEKNRDMISRTC